MFSSIWSLFRKVTKTSSNVHRLVGNFNFLPSFLGEWESACVCLLVCECELISEFYHFILIGNPFDWIPGSLSFVCDILIELIFTAKCMCCIVNIFIIPTLIHFVEIFTRIFRLRSNIGACVRLNVSHSMLCYLWTKD